MSSKLAVTGVVMALAAAAGTAQAEIKVGVSLGTTGPGASLGVHYRNAFQLLPKTLGGEPVRYIIIDDASDPTNAAKNARKLVAEDKVDLLMGSNGVPSALQMAQVAAELGRRVDLPALPPVIGGLVGAWARGDFVKIDPTSPAFLDLFGRLLLTATSR